MARRLKQIALDAINNDSQLYADVSDGIAIKPISLPKLLQRNSRSLAHYDAVIAISKKLKISPDQLLEEEEPKTTA